MTRFAAAILLAGLICSPAFSQDNNLSGIHAPARPPTSELVNSNLAKRALAATEVQDETAFREAKTEFHRSILKAARNRIRNAETPQDKIQARRDMARVRLAMVLPAMRAKVQQAIEMQIRLEVDAGNETEAVPVVDGVVQVANIDWENLIAFLERLIPIILQIIEIFS